MMMWLPQCSSIGCKIPPFLQILGEARSHRDEGYLLSTSETYTDRGCYPGWNQSLSQMREWMGGTKTIVCSPKKESKSRRSNNIQAYTESRQTCMESLLNDGNTLDGRYLYRVSPKWWRGSWWSFTSQYLVLSLTAQTYMESLLNDESAPDGRYCFHWLLEGKTYKKLRRRLQVIE